MLEKGIVLEIREQYAIVLKPGGEMTRIKRKDGLKVGAQIYILPEDHYTLPSESARIPFQAQNRRASPGRRQALLRQLAGLAAVLVLIVTLALYPGVQAVYAVASFDGERDIQLELDRRSRIMNGYSYGEQLPEEELQKLKGQKLADVGEELTDFMGNGPVLIGYASYKEDAEGDAQTEQILREMFSSQIILYLSGNSEDIELAESTRTSLGFHLAGEVVDDDTRGILDDFLEDYLQYQGTMNLSPEPEDEDFSHLNDMDLDELLDEIHRNPAYEGNDEVLEILADKLEELHEDHKEQTWEQDDSDEDPEEADTDNDDSDSDTANQDRDDSDADDDASDDND